MAASPLALVRRLLSPVRSPAAVGEQVFAPEHELADQPMRQPVAIASFGWWIDYAAEEITQPNYRKARALFYNRLSAYRLAAGFCRPIINTPLGFIATPDMSTRQSSPEADAILAAQLVRWKARLYLATRNWLRDGDVYARLDYAPDPFQPGAWTFNLGLIPPERVDPTFDPISGRPTELVIHHPLHVSRPGRYYETPVTLIEKLTDTTRRFEIEGPLDVEVRGRIQADLGAEIGQDGPNPWGTIPIVHFRNEPEDQSHFGASDIEPLDALLRAYHDTMLLGLTGIQLFARPKVKLQVKDVDQFIATNFPEALKTGGTVNFRGREILILREGDDAAYITADPGTEGIQILLEHLFYCIVQASETPEFVFGTAVASSKASVSEQMTPFAKKIERKRLSLTEPYLELGALYLRMASQVGMLPRLDSYLVDLAWPETIQRDELATANTIKSLADSFIALVQANLVSAETAAEFLRTYITTMLAWSDPGAEMDEQRRILASAQFLAEAAAGGAPPEGAPGSGLAELLARMNGNHGDHEDNGNGSSNGRAARNGTAA